MKPENQQDLLPVLKSFVTPGNWYFANIKSPDQSLPDRVYFVAKLIRDDASESYNDFAQKVDSLLGLLDQKRKMGVACGTNGLPIENGKFDKDLGPILEARRISESEILMITHHYGIIDRLHTLRAKTLDQTIQIMNDRFYLQESRRTTIPNIHKDELVSWVVDETGAHRSGKVGDFGLSGKDWVAEYKRSGGFLDQLKDSIQRTFITPAGRANAQSPAQSQTK